MFFTLDELLSKTELSPIAAKHQLLRLGELVVRITPRQPYFLIVRPEHRAFGAPPVDWWLDDYMRQIGRPYYIALLSAATMLGSGAQAIQQTQVITDIAKRDITLGRIHVKFFIKTAIEKSVTTQAKSAYAPLRISSIETTIFDLVRYANSLGGIERMIETIAPMIHNAKPASIDAVLQVENEIASIQRLGFIFEKMGAEKFAKIASKWLPKKPQSVFLSSQPRRDGYSAPNNQWKVIDNTGAFR